MRFTSFLLPLLFSFYHTNAAPSGIIARDATSDLLNALDSKGQFSTLTGWLNDNPELIKTIMQSPGPKTIFAPTDDAAAPLPDVVRNNKERLQATLLYHVLNGTLDFNKLSSKENVHTIGHSLLTSSKYVNLPGDNGLPIALRIDSSTGEKQLVEGSNVDGFQGESFNYNQNGLDLTIQPIKRMLSVPGNLTFTLNYHGGFNKIVEIINQIGGLENTLNGMKGVTVFAPNDRAITSFLGSGNNGTNVVNSETISTVIMQHVVPNRVLFSPLLSEQGSVINAAGQDLIYDSTENTIRVGNHSAKILQTDLMSTGGVIHLIDSVLDSTNLNQNRATQASNSSKKSSKSGISGEVTGENSATSQGESVPGPDSNNQGEGYRNATGNGNGNENGNGSGNENGNGNGDSSSSSRILISSSTLLGITSLIGLSLLF